MDTRSSQPSPIGVFDSGFGGLTVLKELRRRLPQYEYIYLGDNARAPYGTRSFDLVYQFTLDAVRYLFGLGCRLVILACNTASAKALRSIQQRDLPGIDPQRRVLGVIRPTAEAIGCTSRGGNIGIFATPGTIASQSYDIEIAKLNPTFHTFGHACPMWVPLIENGEADKPGMDYFVRRDVDALLDTCPDIDTIILACTHYPLIYPKIRAAVPRHIDIVCQGPIVAESLADYLRRHPEMETTLSRKPQCRYLTTDDPERFAAAATIFMGHDVKAEHVTIC